MKLGKRAGETYEMCKYAFGEEILNCTTTSEWFIQLEKETISLKDESCLLQHQCKQRKPLFCVFDNTDSDSQFGRSETSEVQGLKETA
jgi:hypothetical protein